MRLLASTSGGAYHPPIVGDNSFKCFVIEMVMPAPTRETRRHHRFRRQGSFTGKTFQVAAFGNGAG